MNRWYKLDNAAKVFPMVSNESYSSVYRVSAILTEDVNKDILQESADHIFSRFPTMFLRLRKGIFWNYFDTNENRFLVQEESSYPCAAINPDENNGYLLRILYYGKRISVEMFHSLSDGGGAVEFLKTVLYYYFIFLGQTFDSEGKIILADENISGGEMEDSFARYYEPGMKNHQTTKLARRSFRVKGTPIEPFGNHVVTGIVSANELIKLAKSKDATLTSYLASLLIYSIYMEQQRYVLDKAPVVVAIPVNLRRLFPSKTLRNFFSVANVETKMDPTILLDDITRMITGQLTEKTGKMALQEAIADNVSLEKKLYSRFIPLWLKKQLVMIGSDILGVSRKTISLSNIGNISVPSGFLTRVNHLEVFLYPTPKSPISCAVCSLGDKLSISFSRTIIEANIIRYFFNHLAENSGLNVEIYSNNWGM